MRKRFTPRVDGHHAAVRNPLGRSRPHMLRRDASHRLRSPGLPASSGPHHQDRVKCSQSCPDILHASEHGMSTLKSHTGPGKTGHRSTQAFHVTPPAPGYERCRGDTGRRKVTPDAMLYSTSLQHMEQNSAAVGTARYTTRRDARCTKMPCTTMQRPQPRSYATGIRHGLGRFQQHASDTTHDSLATTQQSKKHTSGVTDLIALVTSGPPFSTAYT